MMPHQEGESAPRSARPGPWRLFAIPALAALFAFGVALALPTAPVAEPPAVASQACAGPGAELPPGHPPVAGRPLPRGHEAWLPPGHPPVDGSFAPRRAPPLRPPSFQQPDVLDI
jgi:hypothetical protein